MNEKIEQLKQSLEDAARIDESAMADKIKSIGYNCIRCAKCCKWNFGDNTVSIFPFEIRCICGKTGLDKEEIAAPTPSEDRDSEGNIHTFEWILKKNGDCTFLDNDLCKIYECRPFICSTYPFYLLEGHLMVSECEGIGEPIDEKEAMNIARLLKERYIAEIRESIALIEKFRGFRPGGLGNICVHDSQGEHWIFSKNLGKI